MSSNANNEKVVEDTFGACWGDDWCPRVVQVAMATNRMGTLGKERGEMTLRKVVAARDMAEKAMEGLSINRGTSPRQDDGPRKLADRV